MAHIEDYSTQKANLEYIQNSMNEPLLSREDEYAYACKWREEKDEAALHKLVKPYMRLVISIAGKFKNYGLPFSDIVQEGNIGLMMAASRFDTSRNVRFSTYAGWWIKSCIQDYVLRNWSIVRTGTTATQKTLFFKLRRLRAQIEESTQRNLDYDGRQKIAETLQVNVGDVEAMEARLSGPDSSLNAPASKDEDGSRPIQDFLPDDRPLQDDLVISRHDGNIKRTWLKQAINQLSEREQIIIKHRRLQNKGETLEALGEKLGVSKERVRQLESRAMGKLRSHLKQKVPVTADLL